MMFQNRSRSLTLLSAVAVTLTLGCTAENGKSRHGDDLLVSGSSPTVYDSVPGDVIMLGGSVSFSGSTGADYLGAGGQQAIAGRVHGSLRATGGEVHVAAAIDRNATIVSGNVELDSVGGIGGNAYFVGGNVQVDGAVRGGLLVDAGNATLNGVIGRDVEVSGGGLTIGPHAQIAGNLRYRVPPRNVHINPAARISGTVTALPVASKSGFGRWVLAFGFLLAGVVVVSLFPGFASDAAARVSQSPARSALIGLAWFCLVPLALIIGAVTVIGLPLAVITGALYLAVVSLATVPFSIWVGQRVLSGRVGTGRQGALMNFLVGGLVLLVVGLIPVVGGPLQLIAAIVGLGTIMLQAAAVREGQAGTTA